jgi:hypothetical protein
MTDNFFSVTLPASISRLEPILIEELSAALVTAGERVKQHLRDLLNDPSIKASGKSAASIERDEEPTFVGGVLGMSVFPTGDRAKVMRYIDEGRRPKKKRPPIDAIIDWMIEKELDVGMSDRELRGAAYVIARKIGRDGLPGKQVFSKARKQIRDDLPGILQDAVARALSRISSERLKDGGDAGG